MPSFEPSPGAVLALAVVLDLILADPPGWPHPVRWMGRAIRLYEGVVRRPGEGERWLRGAGAVLAVALPVVTWLAAWAALDLSGRISPWLGFAVGVYLAYTCLSLAGLGRAVTAVARHLAAGDLDGARRAVGHIVGRDTAALDGAGVAGAAVESAAENSSDGVIAPLFYLALGGPALGLAYKAINTADSMIGYRDGRYRHFGWGAARLDDLANWVPARLTFLLLAVAAALLGHSARGAWRAGLRDAGRHPSPNAGWPEAAVAGALGVTLGGDAVYGGAVHARPILGGGGVPGTAHVVQAARLIRVTGLLAGGLAVLGTMALV